MQPPSPIQVFPGVQFHGTTYFSQAPAPSTGSSPQFPWSYPSLVHSAPSVHSPYSRDSIPYHSPYYETVPNLPPTSAVPRAFMPHPMDDVHRISGMPAVSDERVSGNGASETGRATNDDFPYCPPTVQRAGHARRVSVTLKSKEDTDALGLRTATQQGTIRRQSWMGHRQREDPAHRSWPWSPDGVGTSSQSQSLQVMY
ncbi:hypothetical protein PHLCEN_2v1943 [Hermanssonia centrifuga]|uniref:Uncharacterized protein n=1 Tax=Hermanssonia centrifuga TaxID=98765 RepID=A0A2R6RVI2_9APHY|nr:hypothetical protein PHLCEN_2v1943 [Hermanssonia centrifuga]